MEEFYFDDDFKSRKIHEETHMKLQGVKDRVKKKDNLKSSFHNVSVLSSSNGRYQLLTIPSRFHNSVTRRIQASVYAPCLKGRGI